MPGLDAGRRRVVRDDGRVDPGSAERSATEQEGVDLASDRAGDDIGQVLEILLDGRRRREIRRELVIRGVVRWRSGDRRDAVLLRQNHELANDGELLGDVPDAERSSLADLELVDDRLEHVLVHSDLGERGLGTDLLGLRVEAAESVEHEGAGLAEIHRAVSNVRDRDEDLRHEPGSDHQGFLTDRDEVQL
jgi:hypothetical protein